jgi:hypothetical protein
MSVTPKHARADQSRRKPIFFWIALLFGVVMLEFYLFGGVMVARYGTVTRDSGCKPERRAGQWYVAEVDPQDLSEHSNLMHTHLVRDGSLMLQPTRTSRKHSHSAGSNINYPLLTKWGMPECSDAPRACELKHPRPVCSSHPVLAIFFPCQAPSSSP